MVKFPEAKPFSFVKEKAFREKENRERIGLKELLELTDYRALIPIVGLKHFSKAVSGVEFESGVRSNRDVSLSTILGYGVYFAISHNLIIYYLAQLAAEWMQ